MLIATATMTPLGKPTLCLKEWRELCVDQHLGAVFHNHPFNFGVTGAYDRIYRDVLNGNESILCYLHSDVELHERGWDRRVMHAFEDPKVGVVGFGGGRVHGSPDLYRKQYKLEQLARGQYVSNMKDAEAHGERFDGVCEVAVLDGFALIVRRELLDKCNGWDPDNWPPHHIYDYRICAEAHRHGYKVMMVGVACHHRGGETAVSEEYQKWAAGTKWGSDAEMHKQGHRKFYSDYKDVLPWVVR